MPPAVGDVVEVQHARRLLRAQPHDVPEMRQPARLHEIVGDLQVVRGLERRRQDQRLALDLVHRVLELGAAVGRVDVDQDQPCLGRRELGQGPFRAVGRPDADPVAALQPQRQQAGREIVDAAAELAPAPADVLVAHHQRFAVAVGLDGAVEEGADGLADQLLGRNAVVVGNLGNGRTLAGSVERSQLLRGGLLPAMGAPEIAPPDRLMEAPHASARTRVSVPQAVVPQAVVPQAVVPQAVVPQAVVPQAVVPRPREFPPAAELISLGAASASR